MIRQVGGTQTPRESQLFAPMSMMLTPKLRIVALATVLGWSCSTGPTAPPEPPPVAPEPVDHGMVARNRILVIENLRADPQGELAVFARDVEEEVRVAAVRALGRFPFPEHGDAVTAELITSLHDRSAKVRGLAAFGLGLRKDPASAAALKQFISVWENEDEEVCALVVEAAGRFEDPGLRKEVMFATDHSSAKVRAKAARAAAMWDPADADAAVVDIRLATLASRAPLALLKERWSPNDAASARPGKEDTRVIWSALYSLWRRKSELGRDVYYLWCRAESSVEARIFATRGLALLADPSEEDVSALIECLGDRDWRVAVAAAQGLHNSKSGPARVALETTLDEHQNIHVKLACIDALGTADQTDKLNVETTLNEYLVKSDPRIKAHTFVALARLGGIEFLERAKDEKKDTLKNYGESHRSIVRRAVVQACEFFGSDAALPLLDTFLEDESRFVASAAAEAYGKHLEDGGRARAQMLLSHEDYGIRIGALYALKEGPSLEDLTSLTTCYDNSVGENSDEIKMEILTIAGSLEACDGAEAILRRGLSAENPYLQKLAHTHLVEKYRRAQDAAIPFSPRKGDAPTLERRSTNPHVRISTEAGDMTFELYPEVAPVHVHNFLQLARNGHYDGLTIHRVVPAFVIQGGDHRGDGNGGLSWRENHEPLRAEFNELPYERGSLGMPRNADPDSGGSQWFVTHMPTPRLDGRYTLFGKMTLGHGGVLDKVMVGHEILSVRVVGE